MSTIGETTANTVVEVEFQVADSKYALAALSAQTGGTADLKQVLPRSDGAYTVFQRITGASPDSIHEFTHDWDGIDATVINADDNGLVVEFLVNGATEFFTVTLTDAGAIPTQLASRDGIAHIVAEIPTQYCPTAVIDQFRTTYPEMEMVARRQKDYAAPLFSPEQVQALFEDLLTPRQREVLMTAYTGGYFEWPRNRSAEELAAELGISAPTFTEHLRIAERKLLSLFFTE